MTTSHLGAVLAIVPARGGSKGIPRKNLAPVGGRSLVSRAVAVGREAGLTVLLSTDDAEIRAEGIEHGAIAPFTRPAHLATDEASTVAVLQHAVQWFETETGGQIATVVVLQPTSPLRTAGDVLEALNSFGRRPAGSRSLISLSTAGHLSLGILYQPGSHAPIHIADPARTSRHETQQLLIRNGAVYITERDLLMKEGRVMCSAPAYHLMPRWRSINVDDPFELYLARHIAEHPPSGPAEEA